MTDKTPDIVERLAESRTRHSTQHVRSSRDPLDPTRDRTTMRRVSDGFFVKLAYQFRR